LVRAKLRNHARSVRRREEKEDNRKKNRKRCGSSRTGGGSQNSPRDSLPSYSGGLKKNNSESGVAVWRISTATQKAVHWGKVAQIVTHEFRLGSDSKG